MLIWIFAWTLFLIFQIFNFWEIYFTKTQTGFALWLLSLIYFIEWFFIGKKLGFENIKNDNKLQNWFYSFIALAISILSTSIAFIFSKNPEIIASFWLVEATILYFFYSKNNNAKIFFWATILFIIWIFKLTYINNLSSFVELSLIFIFWLLIYNLYLISKQEENFYNNIHYIFHLIWIFIIWNLLINNFELLAISVLLTILWYFYNKFNIVFLKIVFVLIFWNLALFHIFHLGFSSINYLDYVISTIIISNYFIWKKFGTKNNNYSKILWIIVAIYSFIISNLYVLDLFGDIFWYYTLTIYWWLIASILLIYWIQKDIIKYRTLWLYFLVLTISKIFLLDVWQISSNDARWWVFLILWIILIFISTLYTKKFWDNLTKEFDISNLLNKEKETFLINQKIKNIDVSKYKAVKFKFNNWKSLSIRAENLVKITKLVTDMNNKTSFKAKELNNIYDYIVNNYKTELSPSNYKKILEIMEKFVEFWGSIEFVEK